MTALRVTTSRSTKDRYSTSSYKSLSSIAFASSSRISWTLVQAVSLVKRKMQLFALNCSIILLSADCGRARPPRGVDFLRLISCLIVFDVENLTTVVAFELHQH